MSITKPNATFLNNQAKIQSEMGQRTEALRSIGKAVQIRRKLAEGNTDAFLPALAQDHGRWGHILSETDPTLAMAKFADRIKLIAPLVAQLPQVHLALAFALSRDYLHACQSANIAPKPEILAHIAAFEKLRDGISEA